MNPTLCIKHQILGELVSYDDPNNPVIDWTPVDFAQRDLEFCVLGNSEGPILDDANEILEISEKRNLLVAMVEQFLIENQDRYLFVAEMMNFEMEWIEFFDQTKSSRFYMHCMGEFFERSKFFPKTDCQGNGFWKLKFEIDEMKVVDLVGE